MAQGRWREIHIYKKGLSRHMPPPPLSGVPRLQRKTNGLEMNERAPLPPHSLCPPAVWRKGQKMYRRCLHRSSGSSSRTAVLRHSFGDYGRENQEIKRQKTSAKLQLFSFFIFPFFHQWKWQTPTRRANLSARRERMTRIQHLLKINKKNNIIIQIFKKQINLHVWLYCQVQDARE